MQKQAFISWSGDSARLKARSLRALLADVLPEANVFMSDEDIAAGSLWLTAVAGSLDASVAGVILVNPDNLKNPWVHYEAGALATRVETRRVIPLLSGMTPSDLSTTPLSIFQARVLDKDAIQEVCLTFAAALDIPRARESILRGFEKWWDDYSSVLLSNPVSLAKPPKTIDELHNLVSQMQSQLRSQSEMIAVALAANQGTPRGGANTAFISPATQSFLQGKISDVTNSVNAANSAQVATSPSLSASIAKAAAALSEDTSILAKTFAKPNKSKP